MQVLGELSLGDAGDAASGLADAPHRFDPAVFAGARRIGHASTEMGLNGQIVKAEIDRHLEDLAAVTLPDEVRVALVVHGVLRGKQYVGLEVA